MAGPPPFAGLFFIFADDPILAANLEGELFGPTDVFRGGTTVTRAAPVGLAAITPRARAVIASSLWTRLYRREAEYQECNL